MNYFLTIEDIKNRRKVLFQGRVVTCIEMSGDQIRLAEDGQWHPHLQMLPLTSEQIRQETIDQMAAEVAGKTIATLIPEGAGVSFVLEDNTRVGLSYGPDNTLKLSVTDPDGERIL